MEMCASHEENAHQRESAGLYFLVLRLLSCVITVVVSEIVTPVWSAIPYFCILLLFFFVIYSKLFST